MSDTNDAYNSFWTDWMLAADALKGVRKVSRRTLKRWEKEVADWYDANAGREHT